MAAKALQGELASIAMTKLIMLDEIPLARAGKVDRPRLRTLLQSSGP